MHVGCCTLLFRKGYVEAHGSKLERSGRLPHQIQMKILIDVESFALLCLPITLEI